MSSPVLVTKLFIPATRSERVTRPRLTQRLDEGVNRKLTLISAPAGFGKSTLVTEWLGTKSDDVSLPYAVAWVSLDENDNDPVRFLTYLVESLHRTKGVENSIGVDALALLQSPQPPSSDTVLTSLINEIAGLQCEVFLVLDDYHLIEAQAIHEALTFLLENLPAQLHLVIATREDPLLPLSRLRARNQLTELRATDLRFTPAEAADFLNQVMGLDLTSEEISALEERTEGWIAGLQLAAISLKGQVDTSRLIQTFTGSNRLVLDYLIEEVLDRQPKPVQEFLLQTALLDQMSGDLCKAVTGQENAQEILENLERANLFIISLDAERRWYRYHHLFTDLLQQQLQRKHPDLMPQLHRSASEWYEAQKQFSDAVRHALAAQDFERVAGLAELAWPTWNEGYLSLRWLDWVKAIPEGLIRVRPVLCVAYAQALLNAGQLEAAETRLLDVERWLSLIVETSNPSEQATTGMVIVDKTQFQALPAWLATTRAYHAQAIGDAPGTVKYVEQALDLLPEEDHYNRAAVTGLLGLAHWTNGDLKAAYKIFSEGMFQNVHDRIKGTFVLSDMLLGLGQLREAESVCEQGLKLAKAYDPLMPIGTEDIYSGMSGIHREKGDLEAAAQDLAVARKLGEQVDLPDWEHRWCIAQARLQESLGNLDHALDLLDQAEHLFVQTPVPVVYPIAALKAQVWVRQGQLDKASNWIQERGLAADEDISYLSEFEHLTFVRVLILQYQRDHVDAAIHTAAGLLERLRKAAEEKGRTGSILKILVLQALTFDVQGDIPSANKSLEQALLLAAGEGYCRIFIDEGPPIARLLYELISRSEAQSQGVILGYLHRLLAAFPDIEPKQLSSSKIQSADDEWIEPLSERELEVLQLIADGLANQAIASKLYLSPNTVKAHTRSIYGKLNVNSRTQAVAKAVTLGLLSSS